MKKIVFFNAEDQDDLIVEQQMIDPDEFELVLANGCKDDEMGEVCSDADGVVTIYSTIDEKALIKMKNCKCIALQAIGFNNVDLNAAAKYHVAITNVPDFCLQEVATHTTALALACVRQIPQLNQRVKNHIWDYRGSTMRRLNTMTYGLIAFGNIAKAMVPMLKGFGLRVAAYDPYGKEEDFKRLGVEQMKNIDALLAESDLVSLHLPLNNETENFMNEEKFSKMKKTAYFINTSRGGTVDEKALYSALTNGVIAGAALDVLKNEKECSSPLIGLENVILTPHMAFYSEDSAIEMRQKAFGQVLQMLKDNRFPDNLINRDVTYSHHLH